MPAPFPAYRGNEPFVFVCYAHSDEDRVYPELAWLRDQGVNIWYDEGISAGANWRSAIGDSLLGASHVLFFVSKAALRSDHCNREVNLALDERKTVVPVYLDEVELSSDMKVGLSRVHALHPGSDASYRERLLRALGVTREPQPTSPPKSSMRLAVLGGMVVLAMVGAAVWWYSDRARTTSDVVHTESSRTHTLAVLPFLNLSDDPEQTYFAEGLSEELINVLAQTPGLKVSGRTSSFAFKDQNVGLDVIGERLGVEHVLEGSVRRAGKVLRITAQLIDARDGFHLWSATYDREIADILDVQDEIAGAVAKVLKIKLGVSRPGAEGGTDNADAHVHYMVGKALLWQHTPPTTERAIAELQAALRLDPEYALAWLDLAYSYGARSRDPAHREEALKAMADAAARGQELAPDLWRSEAVRAWVEMSFHDFLAAELAMSRAIALRQASGDTGADPDWSNYLGNLGRWTQALAEDERIRRQDPLVSLAETLYVLGRKEEAMVEYQRDKRLGAPATADFEFMLVMDQTSADAMNAIVPGFSDTPVGQGLLGPRDAVLAMLRDLLAAPDTPPRGTDGVRAMIAERQGDLDLALAFLRREYLAPGFGAYILIWRPGLRQTRATAGFKDFVRELGLERMWRETSQWGDFCRPLDEDDFVCT